MKPKMRHFKLNMPADLMVKLKEIAEREARSVTAQINLMLRRQVESEEATAKK